MVPDSAGAGEFRGGVGYRRRYLLMEDAVVVRRADRGKFPPRGLAGGKDGGRNRFVLNPGTPREQEMPTQSRCELAAGDSFMLQSAGGGGYGDPRRRDRAAVARDSAEGYVTRTAAQRDYGDEE
jgi:N-methylhydantoinase B